MLLTVTTLRDSTDNVTRFVEHNLACGVDHLVVFLDAPRAPGQQDVRRLLEEHDHVTVVPTDAEWWRGDRPKGLNVRQRINANLTRTALARHAWAEWLVHLDGDEVAVLDRAVLAGLAPEVTAFRLEVLESVSTRTATEPPTRFKRLLEPQELTLLQVLGVVGEATNQSYFHGHVMGKTGIRPSADLTLSLHHAHLPTGGQAEPFSAPGLRVLHYDAWSGEEFIRKWTAMLGGGPVRFRADRAPTATALRTLVGLDLDEERAAHYLGVVYERTTQDAVEVLSDLGFLEEVDPARGDHVPEPLGSDRAAALTESLRGAAERPLREYDVADAAGRPGPRRGLGRLRRG